MKLSKFANLVKNGGRCAVLHVAGSGIWLSTGTAIYRATELPDMEGSEQVRTVLDMTADAWKKVYLTEDWPESVSNVLGLNLAPYAQGEQDTEKLKVAAAPNGLWCSACRCKVDGELIFYNEAYLAPLTEEPVEVLSMYDGMSCGHIALDKLGVDITVYYATEIDKYAIQTTQHNYPETVQLGDAFQVRDDEWRPRRAAEVE